MKIIYSEAVVDNYDIEGILLIINGEKELNKFLNNTKWPLEEIGKGSVNPCKIPSKIYLIHSIKSPYNIIY